VAQNLKGELIELRDELIAAMAETVPRKDFSAALVMAMVWLHVIEARIRKSRNLEERRHLIDEFNSRKETIGKGIGRLREEARRRTSRSEFHRRRSLP